MNSSILLLAALGVAFYFLQKSQAAATPAAGTPAPLAPQTPVTSQTLATALAPAPITTVTPAPAPAPPPPTTELVPAMLAPPAPAPQVPVQIIPSSQTMPAVPYVQPVSSPAADTAPIYTPPAVVTLASLKNALAVNVSRFYGSVPPPQLSLYQWQYFLQEVFSGGIMPPVMAMVVQLQQSVDANFDPSTTPITLDQYWSAASGQLAQQNSLSGLSGWAV